MTDKGDRKSEQIESKKPLASAPASKSAVSGLDDDSGKSKAAVALAEGVSASDRVELNVGGARFTTTVSTLTRDADSFFAKMFSGRFELKRDSAGSLTAFIDRDGTHFRHVLNYLRDGLSVVAALPLTSTERLELEQECKFYSLPELAQAVAAPAKAAASAAATAVSHFIVIELSHHFNAQLLALCSAVTRAGGVLLAVMGTNLAYLTHSEPITSDWPGFAFVPRVPKGYSPLKGTVWSYPSHGKGKPVGLEGHVDVEGQWKWWPVHS